MPPTNGRMSVGEVLRSLVGKSGDRVLRSPMPRPGVRHEIYGRDQVSSLTSWMLMISCPSCCATTYQMVTLSEGRCNS
jgi:hypothetical protein